MAKYKLNHPVRNPPGSRKSHHVFVKKGNKVVKVQFGDPNMRNKSYNAERRRNFRARHHCQTPGPKWKARYW